MRMRRGKPPVGKNEMRSLLTGPSAPNPAQLAALGSREALSPRRATALMRQTLGHTEVGLTCPARLPTGAHRFGHMKWQFQILGLKTLKPAEALSVRGTCFIAHQLTCHLSF